MVDDVRLLFVFFKQKTAYEMRISDWSSDVCSSDLVGDSDFASLVVDLNWDLKITEMVRRSAWTEHGLTGAQQPSVPCRSSAGPRPIRDHRGAGHRGTSGPQPQLLVPPFRRW